MRPQPDLVRWPVTGPQVAADQSAGPQHGGAGSGEDLASGPRGVGPVGIVLAMVRRDLADGRLFGTSIVLDIAYGIVNLLIFLFISRVLHHSGQQGLGPSATYFDFVAVGLAFMLIAQVTCAQVCARVQEERRSGTLEALVQAPIGRAAAAVGMAAYPLMIGILRSVAYLTVACTVLGVHPAGAHWFGAAIVLLVGAAATTGIAITIGAFAVTFSHATAVSRTIIIALGFLSGAYFPVGGLPAYFRPVTDVLPTRMAIDGLRLAISGGSWWPSALLLTAVAAVLVPVSMLLFTRAIARAVRKGVLSHG